MDFSKVMCPTFSLFRLYRMYDTAFWSVCEWGGGFVYEKVAIWFFFILTICIFR